MQEMPGKRCRSRFFKFCRQAEPVPAPFTVQLVRLRIRNARRGKHRCQAGTDRLEVQLMECQRKWKLRSRSGCDLTFDIVGMDVDQTRHQQTPAKIKTFSVDCSVHDVAD